MASDITLAVGDGARRMTYAELADIRRISVASAMRLVRRKNWARQTGNDGVVRILVPLPAAADHKQRKALLRGTIGADKRTVRRERSRTSDRTSDPDKQRTIEALESAIVTLRAQFARTEARADRAEGRIDELLLALADARTAAMISASEAAVLRTRLELLTGPNRVPWWRRWFR